MGNLVFREPAATRVVALVVEFILHVCCLGIELRSRVTRTLTMGTLPSS
jgi:hypothetical protein